MDGSAYANSPFRGGGRPPSNLNNRNNQNPMLRSNANSAMKIGPYNGTEQPSMTEGNYSDADFDN